MKKLLLLVLLPFSVTAMDNSWQKWIIDTFSEPAKHLAFDLGIKAMGKIDLTIRQAAANRAYRRQVEAQQKTQQQAELNQQKEEANQAAKALVMSEEEKTGQEFDRCLNESFGCHDLSGLGIPKRCNSPARRYFLFNESAAQVRIALFKQRTQGGAYKVIR